MPDKRRKYQLIGLAMIFIMFFSTIGFAALSSVKNIGLENEPTQTSEQKTIERHTIRPLTDQEKSALLQNGVTIFEFLHTKDCAKCAEYRPVLEAFSTKYPNIVLVDADSDKDLLQVTGKSTKQIVDVTEKSLLDAFCDVAFVQPKDCILKNF